MLVERALLLPLTETPTPILNWPYASTGTSTRPNRLANTVLCR